MVYALNYRRPAYVHSSRSSINSVTSGKSESASSTHSCPYGIPDALSFDKIISGGTCPPVTAREFMDFLKYIELSAENLQFYLWYRDYVKRFSDLKENEKRLVPEWTPERAEEVVQTVKKEKIAAKMIAETPDILKGTDFDPRAKIASQDNPNPFNTPPRTPSGDRDGRESTAPSAAGWSEDASTLQGAGNYSKRTAAAFEDAEAMQPFTIQPFREEISRIIAIYIADGGQRQLNLSSKERAALLKALSMTTHPSAFRDVVNTVEWTLRHQAHPNFIRWTICNGNPPRQTFARGLGVATFIAGLFYFVVVTLSSVNRGWRALGALLVIIGVATLFAGWKGMCVVLHGMHHRHLRPWELFCNDDDASSNFDLKKGSFDSLGSNNSYEDEPWVAKYDKRNVVRKVFDREVWIQEPVLRQIQDTIFLQAILSGVVVAAVLLAIFIPIPAGNYY